MVNNLPAMLGTQVRSLTGEGPLEKGMATHFSILAWKIPWIEESHGLQSIGLQESDTAEMTEYALFYNVILILFINVHRSLPRSRCHGCDGNTNFKQHSK